MGRFGPRASELKEDQLHKPLGLEGPRRGGAGRSGLYAFAAVGFAAAAGLIFWVVKPSPQTQTDIVRADIVREAPPPPAPEAPAPAEPKILGGAASMVDVESGVKVVRGGSPSIIAGSIIKVPSDPTSPTETSGGLSAAPDPRLVENGKFGPLPRISVAGDRPFDIYKRPFQGDAAGPRIAIALTGLGLNKGSTHLIITALRPEISLAFAPIGPDLWAQTAEARGAGHEILLQTPMQPIAAAGGAKWDHELTVDAGAARNLADLRWSMARFPGYFSVMNFLGSKLTMDRSAMTPILQELGDRGLGYLDDGSSPASQAPRIASEIGLRNARADLSVDPDLPSALFDAALSKVRDAARAKGVAIVVAPALPDIVARLKQFVSESEASGFRIVPVSSAMAAPVGPAASAR